MPSKESYVAELNSLGDVFTNEFSEAMKVSLTCVGAHAHEVYWQGSDCGVAWQVLDLPCSEYEHAKQFLTTLFGEPEEIEPWYWDHTKDIPVLKFKITEEMKHFRGSHVNLFSKMNRVDKMYTTLSWM